MMMTRRMPKRVFLGLLVGVAAVLAACGGDDDPVEPKAEPPVVTGVSETIVSPGDTLVVTGSNFASPASGNSVTFTNPLAVTAAFQASATQLRVVVDRDATSGPVTVTTAGGSAQTAAIEVRRGIGEVFVFGGLDAAKTLALPNPTATTQYLVVPHATNPDTPYNQLHAYTIASTSNPPVAAAAAAAPRALRRTVGPREAFESFRWESARELGERLGTPRRAFDAPASDAIAPAAQPTTRQFNVLKTTSGSVVDPASFQRITARLRYNGTKCLVYADVDTLTTGNFTQSDFNNFGTTFDNSIEATNVTYFGGYSDIDGNDKVILLISPVVNRLTPPGSGGFIAGFFLAVDLYTPPSVPSGTTNQGEVLYLLAADPNGFWGNNFPVAATAAENLGTIAHEHEHLTSFSHRIFFQGGTTQVTWLEEGMAHMAEDLNGDNSSNEARGELYREDPGTVSLEDNTAGLEQRGGIYLMLRLLADRYGTDILKDIVQSKCTGRACIQAVTGLGFYDAFAEFLAAQYLSGRGITADARFNYQSIDLADFGPLAVGVATAGGPDVTGSVVRTGGDFHLFSGLLNNRSDFVFTNTGNQARLRSVIVRTQ